MIQKITAIDAQYSRLEARLPVGHELDTNSGLVLVVGPTYSGKTALLRLLETSLQYERHFRENGVSRTWNILSKSGKYLETFQHPKKVEDGWYFTFEGIENYLDILTEALRIPGFDKKRDIKIFRNEWVNSKEFSDGITRPTYEGKSRTYGHFTPYSAFYAVSESAVERLRSLEQLLSKPTDFNVWRYIKSQIAGSQVYLQEFELPQHKKTQLKMEGSRRSYFEFDPTYDGSLLERPENIDAERKWWDESARITGKKVRHYVKPEKTVYDSPGQNLADRLNILFKDIDKFFAESLNPQFNPRKGTSEEIMDPQSFPIWTYESVPKDAQLVVFMDEPTAFLDYRSAYKFVDRIQEALARYNPRLQIFIATNDGTLIENAPRCSYINLYTQPAQSVDRFELLR